METTLATNLALDQELLDRAFRVSGEPTKKAAVTRALQEFIARHALLGADQVFTAGLVLQELLQGFDVPKDRAQLVERLSALAFLQSVKGDHLEAAEVRNSCRRRGVPIGTMDALLIQLCLRNDLTLLTTDQDFHAAARQVAFSLWGAS